MTAVIKEAKNLILAILGLCVLWFLASATVQQAVNSQIAVIETGKWAVATKFLQKALDDSEMAQVSLTDHAVGETISNYNHTSEVQSGTQVDVEEKLVLVAPWSPEMEEAFKLRVSSAIPGATVFEIIGSKYELVPKDYGAVVIRDHRKVFLAPNSILRQLQRPGVTLRDYYSILLRDRKYGPPNALAALDYLRARGWAGKLIDDVDPQDPATASTIRQFLEQKYSISGVPVEITLVPTAISAFLGYLGFSLFGPFVRLRTCKGRIDDEAWIMTVVLPGYIGTMLMVTQTIFAVILFALPLAVMVDQHLVVAPLDGSSRLLWYFAAVGEILCSVSLAAFLLRLSRLRVALRSEAAGRANLDSEKDTPLAPIDQAAL